MSPCDFFGGPGGTRVVACRPAAKRKRCSVCGGLGASKLCDFPVEDGTSPATGTCDKPLCVECAVHREPDSDYCPGHSKKPMVVKADCPRHGQVYFGIPEEAPKDCPACGAELEEGPP